MKMQLPLAFPPPEGFSAAEPELLHRQSPARGYPLRADSVCFLTPAHQAHRELVNILEHAGCVDAVGAAGGDWHEYGDLHRPHCSPWRPVPRCWDGGGARHG